MRRSFILLIVIVGVLFAAAPAALAEDAGEGMPWSVLSRFGGDADGDGRLDGRSGPDAPEVLDLGLVPVVVRPAEEICAATSTAWRLDGRPLAEPERLEGDGCRLLVPVPEGAHTISVGVGGRPPTQRAQVQVEDLLVVALGDSVASGEGNPVELGRKGWLEPRCHRSAAAGFEQAARLLAQGVAGGSPGRSITFVSLSCSGAEVGAGLLGPYGGIDPLPGEADLDPQVKRLRRLAAARPRASGRPSVDAVLVSVGGNDIGFSRVVGTCAATIGNCSADLEAEVMADLARLPPRYERLDRALDSAVPKTPVLISEYFDPTRDELGRFCRLSAGLTSRAEAQWAYEAVLRPLNAEIESAAARGGWRYVGGIAADFERHGYCVDGSERWVRVLSASAFRQGDPWGTMHPSLPGHTAISRSVVAPLAVALGLKAPEEKASQEEEKTLLERITAVAAAVLGVIVALEYVWLLGLGLVGTWPWLVASSLACMLVVAPILLVLWVLVRLVLMWRPIRADDAGADRGGATKPLQIPKVEGIDLRRLLIFGAATIAALVLATFLTGVAGRLILWLRFWSASLPADQAADAVPASELVVVGSHALGTFFVLGLAAAGVAWLLDGRGRVGKTRRGLVAIGLAEVLIAVGIGDFPFDQARELVFALTLSAVLVYFLTEYALALRKRVDVKRNALPRAKRPKRSRAAVVLSGVKRWFESLAPGSLGDFLLLAWHATPFLLLAVAVVASTEVDELDRRLLVLLPVLLAALLFVGPWGVAAPGVAFREPRTDTLRAPRVALALTTVLCVVILIARDEAWLLASVAIAAVLALLCLAVAAASKGRFTPYALAIVVSVPLFGAAATILRGIDSPELQPAAALLKNGRAVCGAFVGESDSRLWMARVRLDERADFRRPRRGAIFSIPSERIAATAIGALEPVAGLEARAVALRDAMLDERGADDPAERPITCAPAAPEEPVEIAAGDGGEVAAAEARVLRRLAERYQPELVIDRGDRFWPIPVRTLFAMRDRRAAACRRPAVDASPCIRLGTPGEFPWTGGRGENIEYPAANNDPDGQYDLMVDALGTADPARSSLVYYLASSGGKGEDRPITIQYWFFYAFNYQPTDTVPDGGFHEGDFESVSVLLSAKTKRPRYIWMARHDKEGRLFPWEDESLLKTGEHPQIFVAKGSHASYESCARQSRRAAPFGLVDDFPACDAGRPLRLVPETTPLADLARVGWACWGGFFGHASGGFHKNAYLINDAPRSPLWQQKYSDVAVEPCRGIADPGGRDGHTEAVVEEGQEVPAELRRRAASMVPLIDRCADWERPAVTGIYMVACDQKALDAYVGGGMERVEQAGVRIDMARPDAPQVGEYALPAVRHNPAGSYLDGWRVTAANPAEVAVFASCPRSGTNEAIAARFEAVEVVPGQPLRLLDRGGGGKWRLVAPDGSTVSDAIPFRNEEEDGSLVPIDPKPGKALACGPK